MNSAKLLLIGACIALNTAFVFGQNDKDAFDAFFKSTYQPNEVNTHSSDRIEELTKYYSKHGKKKSRSKQKEYEEFVYRSNYFIENLNKSGQVFYDDTISAYLNSLKDFLLEGNKKKDKIQVYVTRFPTVNAFTNDFGNIYMNIGTIATLSSEIELLTVLAHEISHILLRHTHKFEEYRKSIDKRIKNEEFDILMKHSFSRKQEYKADEHGIRLLIERGIEPNKAYAIYETLEHGLDPINYGEISTSLLFPGNSFLQQYFSNILLNPDSTYLQIKRKESEDSKTHPPLEERKEKIVEIIQSNPKVEESMYSEIGNFSYYKELAQYILLSSYIENGWYIKGLHLTLKLREKEPNNEFLIKSQAKLLSLLAQRKYNESPFGRFINEDGELYTDTAFIQFKQATLAINSLDFNILALASVQNLYANYPHADLEKTLKFLTNILYKYHQNLFQKGTSGPELIPSDSLTNQKIRFNDMNLVWNLTHDEQKEFKKLTEKEGYVFIPVASRDSSFTLIKYFLDSIAFSEKQYSYIDDYKTERDKYESTLTFDCYNITFDPDNSIIRYRGGVFDKSIDFNPRSNIALVQSSSFYLKRHKGEYYVDHKKSLEHEKSMHSILDTVSYIRNNFSNTAITNISVTDLNSHYYLLKWIGERFNFNDLIYSSVDDKVSSIVSATNTRYLLYNFNIITSRFSIYRKKYITMSYNVLFDVENKGVAYASKIASQQKPNIELFKQLFYLSEYKMYE